MREDKEFIFPMNYKEKEKFLGIVDYKTLILIGFLAFITFLILKNLDISITVRISIFVVTVGFFSILMLVGVNGESMLAFICFVIKYLVNEKVYVYRKTEDRRNKLCINLLKHG